MIELLKTIVYGIVEGITEWLPVSSTGHLILLQQILPLKVSPEFWSMFLVVIQLGAICAVVLFFWDALWPFNFTKKDQPFIKLPIMQLWFKIVFACIPAGIVGVFLDDIVEKYLYTNTIVAIMLILVGIAFILVEHNTQNAKFKVTKLSQLTYKQAFIIGLFQVIAAVLPGTSRSGATIIGSLLIGINRPIAAEFTFFLAIPVMFGASLLKLIQFGFAFTAFEFAILVTGMVVAFFISIFVIKFFMSYIRKHDFRVFGWYRIALGILVLSILL